MMPAQNYTGLITTFEPKCVTLTLNLGVLKKPGAQVYMLKII